MSGAILGKRFDPAGRLGDKDTAVFEALYCFLACHYPRDRTRHTYQSFASYDHLFYIQDVQQPSIGCRNWFQP